MKELHILCGLPGSGKSTLAKELAKRGKKAKIHDVDHLILSVSETKEKKKTFEKLLDSIEKQEKKYNFQVLDGLFLTNEAYEKIVKRFPDWNIVFHVWNLDREICLWNDKYRREKDASITILKAIFEEPDIPSLSIINPHLSVISHVIQKKSSFEVFKAKFDLSDEIRSEPWTISYRERRYTENYSDDYWVDLHFEEEEPVDFDAFDDLIDKINPSIGVPSYKKLLKASVRKDSFSDGDYYTSIDRCSYVCDVKKLFEKLLELKLIKETEL